MNGTNCAISLDLARPAIAPRGAVRSAALHRNALIAVFAATALLGLLELPGFLCGRTAIRALPAPQHLAGPLALLVLHAAYVLGWRRGLTLIAIAGAMGMAAEWIGTKSGAIFGGLYVYHGAAWKLAGVPLVVPLFWAVFIYTGYSLTSAGLHWLGVEKPARRRPAQPRSAAATPARRRRGGPAWLIVPLVLCDAAAVVAIDGLLDPILVRLGLWSWLDGGAHYGVPWGNYAGWFGVSAMAAGAFRTLEYLRPRPRRNVDAWAHAMPAVGYALLLGAMLTWALQLDMPALAGQQAPVMGLPAAAHLALLATWKLRRTTLRFPRQLPANAGSLHSDVG